MAEISARTDAKPSDPVKAFCDTLSKGRAVHAYLAAGPAGSGKRAFAREAARALLCKNRGPGGMYCGVCDACVRTGAGSHPDLIELALPAKRASIGVDDIREALAKLAVVAYEGGGRAVIVDNADKLTPQAQNALLKSLEEPRGDLTWFLLTADPAVILPTVRSRCRQVVMPRAEGLAGELAAQGASREYAGEIAFLSGGAAGRARELYASEAFFACRAKAAAILSAGSAADVPDVWQSIRGEKEAAADILLWLEGFASDGLRAACGLPRQMGNPCAHFTFARWKGIIDEIMLIRKKLGSNVPWATAVEPILWKIVEGETK